MWGTCAVPLREGRCVRRPRRLQSRKFLQETDQSPRTDTNQHPKCQRDLASSSVASLSAATNLVIQAPPPADGTAGFHGWAEGREATGAGQDRPTSVRLVVQPPCQTRIFTRLSHGYRDESISQELWERHTHRALVEDSQKVNTVISPRHRQGNLGSRVWGRRWRQEPSQAGPEPGVSTTHGPSPNTPSEQSPLGSAVPRKSRA